MQMTGSLRIGIDTGGTFTDLVLLEESGRATQLKVPSTPDDPARALIGALRAAPLPEGGTIGSVAHGTTVATNAMLEERFHRLALVTTRGFRHVLEIARQSVPSGYGNSYFWVKPDRIVPLERVFEVTERMSYRGEVLTAFDEADARAVARALRAAGVEAVGICFLHAYANPEHERRMREILRAEHPGAVISISCEVWPEYREYERTVTTLVDAFVKPHVTGYLERAAAGLREIAPAAPLLIMKSNGGVLPAAAVTRQPISTALSGPAAGALGASWLARQAGYERVITIDTGGTSTDVCLVEGAEPQLTREGRIGRFPVRVPMIDIVSVGTGGGSIAWVGPDGGLCEAGVRDIATRLGLTTQRAAEGILELSAHNQANAVLQLTVKRGIDPAGDTLVAFGGAGPLQAARIAQILGLHTVLIPPSPGNVSAFGLLAVDLKDDYVVTLVQRHDEVDGDAVAAAFAELEGRARASLREQGVAEERMVLVRSVDARYLGEAHELAIPVGGDFDPAQAIAAFHDAHERVYGYAYRSGEVVEFVNWKVTGLGTLERPALAMTPPAGRGLPCGERAGFSVYKREDLPAGRSRAGPALVEEYGSTTVTEPGFVADVDLLGNLVLHG